MREIQWKRCEAKIKEKKNENTKPDTVVSFILVNNQPGYKRRGRADGLNVIAERVGFRRWGMLDWLKVNRYRDGDRCVQHASCYQYSTVPIELPSRALYFGNNYTLARATARDLREGCSKVTSSKQYRRSDAARSSASPMRIRRNPIRRSSTYPGTPIRGKIICTRFTGKWKRNSREYERDSWNFQINFFWGRLFFGELWKFELKGRIYFFSRKNSQHRKCSLQCFVPTAILHFPLSLNYFPLLHFLFKR